MVSWTVPRGRKVPQCNARTHVLYAGTGPARAGSINRKVAGNERTNERTKRCAGHDGFRVQYRMEGRTRLGGRLDWEGAYPEAGWSDHAARDSERDRGKER